MRRIKAEPRLKLAICALPGTAGHASRLRWSLEIPYCATGAGPHVIEVEAAVDGPYSAAIAICARKALPKTLPKAAK